ncbi:MAG: pyridoxamine 5'-phosphate oxidase [Gammaproteobacteria bacterium]|nr:pyridoxamine 5'-phosphate oxidase [Gammaproteobacteria bacterium]NNF61046.1 pyridoxamine 5'-phosphate oxidase [Gammaproteobacteria bacterium]NNM21441.1 pyridoxamine 5'-phosphate oxidase [Gammaproteobacteria bacterium]
MNPLQDSLPANPLQVVSDWLADARDRALTPNSNAMVLGTVAMQKGEILPSARVVLCKKLDVTNGYLVFYSNYNSRKGDELQQIANAAAVFHWDVPGRQARVEGIVLRAPDDESDGYFAGRPRESQLSAWASAQSEPVATRAALSQQMEQARQRFAGVDPVPRPPHWGGYHLWATAVELWVEGDNRLHDRARWIRTVAIDDNGVAHPDAWTASRLQP